MSKKSSTFAADFVPMSEQRHIIIDLRSLPIGMHSFDIQLNDEFFASLEKTEILNGHISATAALNLREEDYQLSIAVHGTVFVVCDRCLEPMPLDIHDEQEIFSEDEVVPDETGKTLDGKGTANAQLDLSWLAYEIVSINIPLVHSHQPGECNKQMELLLHNHLCDDTEPEDN